MKRYRAPLVALAILLGGCAHAEERDPKSEPPPEPVAPTDEAGSPDSILGPVEGPPHRREEPDEEPPPEPAPEEQLDRRTETEDGIVSTVDPEDRGVGGLEVPAAEKADPSAETEDPIVTDPEDDARSREEQERSEEGAEDEPPEEEPEEEEPEEPPPG